MFERLARIVDRRWQVLLSVWGLLLLLALGIHLGWINWLGWLPWQIPAWRDVAKDGEFAFLPAEMQSLAGERLLARAFPEDLLKSSVVIVVVRYEQPIRPEDLAFIDEVLKPRLEEIRDELLGDAELEVRTHSNPSAGRLLTSDDQEASLVIMPLKSEFLEWGNKPVIDRIEKLLRELPFEKDPGTNKPVMPLGLDLAMSGSATVGRDMLVANDNSAKATELWTIGLVALLLWVIYRAPLLAAIPFVTVLVSVQVSQALLILLTQSPLWDFQVFVGLEVYITVVVYGTGVDYCLFLIARYKEEIDKGLPLPAALSATVKSVGAALTASAATVICGIGMMVFAQFGKFRQAGVGISLSLVIGLLAALTLTPALLRMAGRNAFYPHRWVERIPSGTGWLSGTSLFNRLGQRNRFQILWETIGAFVVRRPGKVLAICILAMLPFALLGLWNYNYLSYGLLSELPADMQSVKGAKAVQEHFPAGYAGPLTILVESDPANAASADFSSVDGSVALETLISRIKPHSDRLGIADIRYLNEPLGLHQRAGGLAERAVQKRRGKKYYVSSVEELHGHVTRIDVIFKADPFARESIEQLNGVEREIKAAVQESIREADHEGSAALLRDARFHFVGPTASIRDLKTVTDHDQVKIDLLVLASVFLILVILLRKPAISAYLIVSVFFSYFVALGVTLGVFWLLDPQGFSGLDWKVPMFLFTILMAIGEDYNIFLMTRIEEEQLQHGLVEGVRIAMLRTGTIISSCGIIMAGTFLSLLIGGTLVGMKQLGFALAFGVLLDTFVVRPLLVPAYLIMLYNGRFGTLGRLLGANNLPPPSQ
jgi:putative drug exporter of the RND superfamily